MSVKGSGAQANEQESMLSGIRKLTELDTGTFAIPSLGWQKRGSLWVGRKKMQSGLGR